MTDIEFSRTTGVFGREPGNSNNIRRITDPAEALAQRLTLRLGFHEGEDPFDSRNGVPYLTTLIDVSNEVARSIFLDEIASCPGVTRVNRLTVTSDTADRRRSVSFAVNGDSGGVVINNV